MRLTLVCEVIRYRLVQVRKKHHKLFFDHAGKQANNDSCFMEKNECLNNKKKTCVGEVGVS